MKAAHLANVAAANFCRVALAEFADMIGDVEFFCCTQNEINTRNGRNFFGFQLGITTCNYNQAFWRLPLDAPHQLAAFLIGIFRHRAGI